MSKVNIEGYFSFDNRGYLIGMPHKDDVEEYADAKLSEYKEKLKAELRKENEELKLKLSGKTFFDEKEVLESQLSESKERIEFLEMQLRHLKENKNTDVPF